MKFIKEWLLNRRAKRVARKLTPWLSTFGEKSTYSKDEILYALSRAKLAERNLDLAMKIFHQPSPQLRQYGKKEYQSLNNKPIRRSVSGTFGLGSVNTEVYDNDNSSDIDS